MITGSFSRKTSELSSYMPIPASRGREFWSKWRISHIRDLANSGRATPELFLPESERTKRPLDRLRLAVGEASAATKILHPEMRTEFCRGVQLSAPIYLGDMSFGALSGIANIAIARSADAAGVIAGTGEGGLIKEVTECRNITIQWASARFGVDIDALKAGRAIVIKIGQGAKPGIGGHLPGVKVTRLISETRRIPIGRDAISPAPHHDIYSIEDLGQRILALKEATKKPVFVKVGATNYIPYIASGIARMGADGIIIDGAGAGTGAAPSVIKNNVGIPIELAVASVDSILRREGLREGFSVVAAGKVSCPEDSVKLIALGADITSLGTASLLALGCLMVHKCHLGYCPAVLTNKISDNPAKILSLDQAVIWLSNLVNGWAEEMGQILRLLGVSSIQDLVGRRDLLHSSDGMSKETISLLGLRDDLHRERKPRSGSTFAEPMGSLWSFARVNMLREMAGTTGKLPAEAEISSMGSVSAPFVEEPCRILDWIVADGAQVTRPSIDPYREEIEVFSNIQGPEGKLLRLSAPIFFTHLPEGTPARVKKLFARASISLGLLFDTNDYLRDEYEPYVERLIMREQSSDSNHAEIRNRTDSRFHIIRIGCSDEQINSLESKISNSPYPISAILVDEDDLTSNLPLEFAVSKIDRKLRVINKRYELSLLAESNSIRGADDIFKLLALGADCVGLGKAALLAIGFEESDREIVFDYDQFAIHLENLVTAMEKEIKLLAGAGGVSSISSSLVGNRELLRSIDLDPSARIELGLKPAGAF